MSGDVKPAAALPAVELRLAAAPDDVELRFTRASLLAVAGRSDEARDEYLVVLARAPAHFGALNDLGTLLHATGFRSAARTAYEEAVARHPGQPMAQVNLANLLLEDGDIDAARGHYEAALAQAPEHREAHQGMARVAVELGDDAAAARHRHLGFFDRFLTALPYRGVGEGTPLLVLVAAAGGNVPTRFLVDDRRFRSLVVVSDFYDRARPLPPHRLVFNAIGDADLCRPALAAAAALLEQATAPVINPPARVMATGRVENAARLAAIPGVRAPRMAALPRAEAADAAALGRRGFVFPLLLRRPGFHTGRFFLRVDGAGELAAALARLPGETLTAIEFLDARGGDGLVRKYRVMIVDGAIHPLHLAVAGDWKVHYFTADMADAPLHRAEEAAFLADMGGVLGRRALAALGLVRDRLGLDYAGIDFALGAGGEILLFEANATMVVNPPDPDPRWAYRKPAVERILAAARSMLARHAGAA